VKKKYTATSKDKKDWNTFTEHMGSVQVKDIDFIDQNKIKKKIKKLDLHGFSLDEANKAVKEFINKYFNINYKKLLIITGKGLRSKSQNNPYVSKKLSMLKYSIPEYIKNEEDLSNKVIRISEASLEDGGEGAIYVFLKKNKLKE
jgi:DNA-nicking Smr family endonuclease